LSRLLGNRRLDVLLKKERRIGTVVHIDRDAGHERGIRPRVSDPGEPPLTLALPTVRLVE
jgi:hypothetical protein